MKTTGLFNEDKVLLYISEDLVITEKLLVFRHKGEPTDALYEKAQRALKVVGKCLVGSPVFIREDELWQYEIQEVSDESRS